MFELYKGEIKVNKDLIPTELEPLTKFKESDNLLLYAFLVVNRSDENPIKDLREQERKRLAASIVYGESFSFKDIYSENEIKEINKIISIYKKSESSGIQRDLDLYDKKIYQFIDLLDATTPEIVKNEHEISGRITFSTNIDIINTVLENSINIILDKMALKELKATGKISTSIRGRLSNKTRNSLMNTTKNQ